MAKLFSFLSTFLSIPEPTPSTMTALHQFGAEMLKLSRGLQSFAPETESTDDRTENPHLESSNFIKS
jgi:5-hydroxytryptamine receptor 2